MKKLLSITLICLLSCLCFGQRYIYDNDRGDYYQYPYNMDFTLYGGYGGQPVQTNNIKPSGIWHRMYEETIKSPHARFQHFESGDTLVNSFPLKTFNDFSADEKRQKKLGLWVTKTIGNHTSKVGFTYTGEAFEDNPILPVVHFSDRRYVKFFANEFCRAILHGEINNYVPVDEPYGPIWKNLIVGIDNYDWDYENYGYTDNSGNFQYGTGFSWDAPYPQNMTELRDAVISFQSQLKEYAPDVPIMVNGGGIEDSTTYDKMFENLAGKFYEGFMNYFQQGYWDRLQIYWQLQTAKWMDKHDKVTIFQADLSNKFNANMPEYKDVIRTMTCAYLIARGQNSFYGLARDTTDYELREILPQNYQYLKDWMGLPTSPFEATYVNDDNAYGLYKRKYDGGWVYLNLTGVTQQINLGGTFYDKDGLAITTLTLPDFRGDVVRHTASPRPSMVAINNRYNSPIAGSISVKISSQTPNTTIKYTTDGSLPNLNSIVYTSPLTLNTSTFIKAIAVTPNNDVSFVNTAKYDITPTLPDLQFYHTADTVSEFLKNGYALVKLSTLSSTEVSVSYTVSGEATANTDYLLTNGTLVFKPFELYKVIRIPIKDDQIPENLENVRLVLSSALGATLGSNSTFDYYIEDNDGPVDVLGVNASSLTGKAESGGNKLSWTTFSEENNSHFEIERSSDGTYFEKIGALDGHGTSDTKNLYSYLDKISTLEPTYYRLKQVDIDGKFQYSITVILKSNFEGKISVYPNPFQDEININLNIPQKTKIEVLLYDVFGRKQNIKIVQSGNAIKCKTHNLQAGSYFLKIVAGVNIYNQVLIKN